MRKVSWGRLVATATIHLVILTQSHPTVNSLSIPQIASDGSSPVTRSDSASVVLHKEILLEKPQQVEGLSLADRIRWGESALEVCLKGKIHCTDCHEIARLVFYKRWLPPRIIHLSLSCDCPLKWRLGEQRQPRHHARHPYRPTWMTRFKI